MKRAFLLRFPQFSMQHLHMHWPITLAYSAMYHLRNELLFWQDVGSPIMNTFFHMFNEELKRLRERHGLKQWEMAERLNIDPSTYSRLERKELPPSYLVERIAKAFGVDAWSWMHSEGETPSEKRAPRMVHMRTNPPMADAEEARAEQAWRSKAIDLLSHVIVLVESLLPGSGKNKGGS